MPPTHKISFHNHSRLLIPHNSHGLVLKKNRIVHFSGQSAKLEKEEQEQGLEPPHPGKMGS